MIHFQDLISVPFKSKSTSPGPHFFLKIHVLNMKCISGNYTSNKYELILSYSHLSNKRGGGTKKWKIKKRGCWNIAARVLCFCI